MYRSFHCFPSGFTYFPLIQTCQHDSNFEFLPLSKSCPFELQKSLYCERKTFRVKTCGTTRNASDYLATNGFRALIRYSLVTMEVMANYNIFRNSTRTDFEYSHRKCSESFRGSRALRHHFSNRHGERNVRCDEPGCRRKYGHARALHEHIRAVHSV